VTRALRTLAVLLLLGAAAESALRASGWLGRRRAAARERQERDLRPGDVNVLCLGCSSVAGAAAVPAEAYPKQLERLLQDIYDQARLRVIASPRTRQDGSEVADPIADPLDLYRPRLVVLMASQADVLAPASSGGTRLEDRGGAGEGRTRTFAALERLQLFERTRLAARRLLGSRAGHEPSEASREPGTLSRLWRADAEARVAAARLAGARVLLMTAPIPPRELPAHEAVELAARLQIPLVRNDLAFDSHRGHPASAGDTLVARNAFQAIWQDDLLGLLPRASPAPEAWAAADRLELGTPAAEAYLGTGWNAPEAGPAGRFRWTEGSQAELSLDLPGPRRRILRARLDPFLEPGRLPRQRVHVLLDGRPIARLWLAEPETRLHSMAIPEPECQGRAALTLLLPDARSPAALGLSDDTRRLGLAFESLGFEDFPEALPGLHLALGTADAETYLGAGWTAAADDTRWMQAPRAELLFRWKRGAPLTLRIKVHALRPRELAGPAMTLELNGQRLDPFRVRPTDVLPAVYELTLPPAALEERNVLAFEWPVTLAGVREPPGLRVESVEWSR
jgi:hypothetical protein